MSYRDREKQRAYQAEYYQKRKETYNASRLADRKKYRKWFRELKSSLFCEVCGENHPACLDFHHLGDKEYEISKIVSARRPKEIILAEIAKCQVLCANCHRKMHWVE